jgi:pyridoxine 4-dehydrogenase
VDVCRELGVEMIAYSPLALGLLTRMPGTDPTFPSGPRRWLFCRLWSDLQPLLEAMAEIAARRGASPAAVALNWCRAHGVMPIAGLRTVAQADAAGDALAWGLEEGERERLDQLALALPSGARMPANPFQST